MKMHLRESKTSKFYGGACPRTPLGSKALWVFGKCTRLLLLSTRLCKNLLKPLDTGFPYKMALQTVARPERTLNPLSPNSDKNEISLYNITTC